jgi:hypothetical protein
VLNAFRHLRNDHRCGMSQAEADRLCSTPFGI